MVGDEITDYQRQKLETAIFDSFPNEVNLEMILRNNYEVIGIKSLNQIVGNETYVFKIHKLVEKLISINNLNKFLEVAIKGYQDTELADFKKYYDSYYEYKFDILISGLNKIKEQPDFVNRFRESDYLRRNNVLFKIWEKKNNKNTIPIDDIVYLLLASFNHHSYLSGASDEHRLKIEDFTQSFLDRGGINIIEDNNYVDQWLNYNKINIPKLNKSISKNANLHIFITIEPLAAVKGKEKKITLKAGLYQLNHGKYENLENLENKECSLKQVPQEIYNSIEKVKKNNDNYIITHKLN